MTNLHRFHLSKVLPLLVVGLMLPGRPALAQEACPCTLTTAIKDSLGNHAGYVATINDSTYVAFPEARARRILFRVDSLRIELEAERKRSAAKDSLIAAMDRTQAAYRRHFRNADSLVAQTTSLYEGYRDLYFTYKRTYSEPWFSFSGGLGAVKDDDNDVLPVVLLGLSVKRLSVWGFVNQQQSGFILGLNYPIRFSLF